MEYQNAKKRQSMRLDSPNEYQRVLRQHMGIFPSNVREFAEKIIPRARPQKNYSR